jgi:hypothetical protein
MKEATLSTRIFKSLADIFDAPIQQEKLPAKTRQGQGQAAVRQDREERKEFSFYTRVMDSNSLEVAGHLSDISSGGFKLDCQAPVPINKDFRFRINLTSDLAYKPHMLFVARSKWCKVDPLDPFVYNVGYQLIQISSEDLDIFNRMMEKYGREKRKFDLRRSNNW